MKSNKYWFKPKTYGYGVQPSSWEGWLVTFGLVGIFLVLAHENNVLIDQASEQEIFIFLGEVCLLSLIFLHAIKEKTDGKMKWRWGNKK